MTNYKCFLTFFWYADWTFHTLSYKSETAFFHQILKILTVKEFVNFFGAIYIYKPRTIV